ncbi:hypothetical protein HDU67_006491 [Dinochytrium kinnereticum]|nr:hypothetical protein HDU67_006491 [Dinochytrium kinnereticum]
MTGRSKVATPSPLGQSIRTLDPIQKETSLPSYVADQLSSQLTHAGHRYSGDAVKEASACSQKVSPDESIAGTIAGFGGIPSSRPHTPLLTRPAGRKRHASAARSTANLLTILCNDSSFPDDDGTSADHKFALSSFELNRARDREANTDSNSNDNGGAQLRLGDYQISAHSVREAGLSAVGKKRSHAAKVGMRQPLNYLGGDSTGGRKLSGAKSTGQLAPATGKKSISRAVSSNQLAPDRNDNSRNSKTCRVSSTAKTNTSVFLIDSDIKMSANAKKLWRRVARKLLEVIRGANMFSSFLNRNAAMIASHIRGTDDSLAKQVRDVFLKAKGARTDEDMTQLDRILVALCPTLDKMGREKRSRLYDTMTYEFHPKGTILSKVGVTAESVYFVISGTVDVGKNILKPQFKYKSKSCGVGSVLGAVTDIEMMAEAAKLRKEDFVLTSDTDFVRVRVDDYIRAVYSHDGGSVDQKVVLLNGFPFFACAQEDLLMTAVAQCEIIQATPDQTLVQEDELYDKIYFVCKGSCVASKSVRFIKTFRKPNTKFKSTRPTIIPWVPGIKSYQNDEILDQRLEIVDIVAGETFPVLPTHPSFPQPIAGSRTKYFGAISADAVKTLLYPLKSYVTINCSASEGCTLLAMSIHEFFGLASNSMVHLAFNYGVRYRISVPLLQEAFLVSIGYKEMSSELTSPLKDFKNVLKGLVDKYKIMNFSPDAVPIEATQINGSTETNENASDEYSTSSAASKGSKLTPRLENQDTSVKQPSASHVGLAGYKMGNLS